MPGLAEAWHDLLQAYVATRVQAVVVDVRNVVSIREYATEDAFELRNVLHVRPVKA